MYRCGILVLVFATPIGKKRHVVVEAASPSASTMVEAVLLAVDQKSGVNN